MKYKAISMVLAVGLLSSSAFANSHKELSQLQLQINRLNNQINSLNQSTAKADASNVLSLNGILSSQMMSNFSGVGREMNILKARQNGSLANQTLTIGGLVQADAFYDHTNQSGMFSNPLAANFPNGGGSNMQTNGYQHLVLNNVKLAATASFTNWLSGYAQLGAYNVGETGRVQPGSSGNFQPSPGISTPDVQQAYVTMGNFAQSPMYGFAGRKEIDFGNFATVDIYSQPLTRTFFMATGNTAGFGYNHNGFNGTISLINGGNHVYSYSDTDPNSAGHGMESINSVIQYQNLYTANANSINNYALNASYSAQNNGVNWILGAGYLYGARPKPGAEAASTGAWDINAKASFSQFDVLAEFVSTVKTAASLAPVPGSITNQYVNSTVFPNAKIQSWTVGGDDKFTTLGYNSVVSLEYSQMTQGHSAWNPYQWVAGYRIEPKQNLWVGLEDAYAKGLIAGGVTGKVYVPGTGININQQVEYAGGSTAINNTIILDVTAVF